MVTVHVLDRAAALGEHGVDGGGPVRRRRRSSPSCRSRPAVVTDPWVGNGLERGVATVACPEVVGDRPVATGPAATAAIWSLCVSNSDLVTHILDIENEGDQIDPPPSPKSTESAQTGSRARLRRRRVWLGPRNEPPETSSRGRSGSTGHHARPPTHFQSRQPSRHAGQSRRPRPTGSVQVTARRSARTRHRQHRPSLEPGTELHQSGEVLGAELVLQPFLDVVDVVPMACRSTRPCPPGWFAPPPAAGRHGRSRRLALRGRPRPPTRVPRRRRPALHGRVDRSSMVPGRARFVAAVEGEEPEAGLGQGNAFGQPRRRGTSRGRRGGRTRRGRAGGGRGHASRRGCRPTPSRWRRSASIRRHGLPRTTATVPRGRPRPNVRRGARAASPGPSPRGGCPTRWPVAGCARCGRRRPVGRRRAPRACRARTRADWSRSARRPSGRRTGSRPRHGRRPGRDRRRRWRASRR